MPKKAIILTPDLIRCYARQLREQERAPQTIQKYVHDLTVLMDFLADKPITKAALLEWKETLIAAHAPASVNAKIAAANGLLSHLDRRELRLRPLKIQKAIFLSEEKELTRAEYVRLVRAAERAENQRLALVIQTICATGIRVSELKFITAEAVYSGRAEVANKGKRRIIFLPEKLRKLLKTILGSKKQPLELCLSVKTGNLWTDPTSGGI